MIAFTESDYLFCFKLRNELFLFLVFLLAKCFSFWYPFGIYSWVSKWQMSAIIPLYSKQFLSFNLIVAEFSLVSSQHLKIHYLHMKWWYALTTLFNSIIIHVIFFFTNWIHGRRLSLIWTASSNLKNEIHVIIMNIK